jgi:hypothetical protein
MNSSYPDDQVARAEARKDSAEIQRDAAFDIAANESARADANAAAADYNSSVADASRTDAIIAARQADAQAAELNTQRHILSNELAYERAAASNNAFGFYLTLGILVAGMLVAGVYLWWRNQNPDSVTILAAPPPVTQTAPPVTVTTPPPPVIVTPPANRTPPPTVNITTPPPTVNFNPAPPANNGGTEASGSTSSGTDNFGSDGSTPAPKPNGDGGG